MKWLVVVLSCFYFIFGGVTLSYAGPPPNHPPVVTSFTADLTAGMTPVEVNLICTTHDLDGRIEGYTVDYGDGSDSETNNTGNFNHTYSHAGTYEAKCTAEDNEGEEVTSDPASVHVAVGNIVIVDIDGCRADTLYDLLTQNDTNGDGKCDKLPFIGKIMGVIYNEEHTFREFSRAI
jgi:PKD repeat protein